MTVAIEQLKELVDPHAQVDLAIGEVAGITGISAHTLRYYERIGLVKVGRDASGTGNHRIQRAQRGTRPSK